MNRRRTILSLAIPSLAVLAACAPPADSPREAGAAGGDGSPIGLGTALLPVVVVRGEPLPPADQRTLRRRMKDLAVPGVGIAVIRDGELAWAGGFGLADVESKRPVTRRTLFQAASISKPVAAMGAMRLVREGLLELDEDVNLRLTSWKVPANELTHPPGGPPRPVTLRGLLSHTAGLTVHGFPGYARDEPIPSTIEVLDGKGNTEAVRVDAPPGTARRYSGGGYTVAQRLMVDAAGGDGTFPDLMKEKVLVPLGMTDSTYEQPLPDALRERAATGYRGDGTPVEGLWHVYPEMAAAGLWSTPADLARFAIAVQRGASGEDGPVIDAAGVAEMLTPTVERGYGLGLGLDDGRFGHNGSNAGFRCILIASVEGGHGAVVMTNSDAGDRLAQEILATLFDLHDWPGMRPAEKVVVELGRDRLEGYAGRFAIEGFGEIVLTVAEAGDRLRFELPDGTRGILRPQSETRFFDADNGEPVLFAVDEATGTVTEFAVSGNTAKRVE